MAIDIETKFAVIAEKKGYQRPLYLRSPLSPRTQLQRRKTSRK